MRLKRGGPNRGLMILLAKPTGRANARPMTGSASSGAHRARRCGVHAGFAPAGAADAGGGCRGCAVPHPPLCSAAAHTGPQQQDHLMPTAGLAPLDETITIEQLTRDPYPIYRRLRRQAPVLRVKSVGRTFLTKAADTRTVKDNAALFSSDDPNTPMKRAFLARTLMRKDHDEHRT